jgi:hypothetical protein
VIAVTKFRFPDQYGGPPFDACRLLRGYAAGLDDGIACELATYPDEIHFVLCRFRKSGEMTGCDADQVARSGQHAANPASVVKKCVISRHHHLNVTGGTA